MKLEINSVRMTGKVTINENFAHYVTYNGFLVETECVPAIIDYTTTNVEFDGVFTCVSPIFDAAVNPFDTAEISCDAAVYSCCDLGNMATPWFTQVIKSDAGSELATFNGPFDFVSTVEKILNGSFQLVSIARQQIERIAKYYLGRRLSRIIAHLILFVVNLPQYVRKTKEAKDHTTHFEDITLNREHSDGSNDLTGPVRRTLVLRSVRWGQRGISFSRRSSQWFSESLYMCGEHVFGLGTRPIGSFC